MATRWNQGRAGPPTSGSWHQHRVAAVNARCVHRPTSSVFRSLLRRLAPRGLGAARSHVKCARVLQNARRADRRRRECAARMSRCAPKSTEFVSAAQRRRAKGGPPEAGKVPSSLREVDAHSSEEAAEPKFDLGTFALVAPDALLELLIRTLEAGQPCRQRVIAGVDIVLAG